MNPTSDRTGSQASDMMPIIVATIRAISAQARAVTITPDSLLLEELALDSLDLVAVILRLGSRLFRRTVLKSGPRLPWWRLSRA